MPRITGTNPKTRQYDAILMVLIVLFTILVSFVLGKGSIGIGKSKKWHKGSQPSLTLKTSSFSFGTTFFTSDIQSV